jgi:hypothetical protein
MNVINGIIINNGVIIISIINNGVINNVANGVM